MARRRRNTKKRKFNKNKVPTKESTKRSPMLGMRYVQEMKYDLRQILKDSKLEEIEKEHIIANIIAKGTRNSTRDAKDYLKSVHEEGMIDDDELKSLLRLMDRYTRIR